MIERLRAALRRLAPWVALQELRREGPRAAWRRARAQRRALATPPLRTPTATACPLEVRVLTWRRDWKNAVASIKSLYACAELDVPLAIHDGGLLPGQLRRLGEHFPDARLVPREQADREVEAELRRRGHGRALAYRRRNPAMLKLIDVSLLSRADEVIAVDPDVLFFARPDELLDAPSGGPTLFLRDVAHAYSLGLDELEAAFGVRPPALANSGVMRAARASLDLAFVESALADARLERDTWVTEQTLQALCAARHRGLELLPPGRYVVGVDPGLPPGVVCKHYPGFFRPLFYEEGLRRLLERGLLLGGRAGGARGRGARGRGARGAP